MQKANPASAGSFQILYQVLDILSNVLIIEYVLLVTAQKLLGLNEINKLFVYYQL